ncbi:hypothetical protein JJB09_01980 [Rhizobium sp. KVB221]|uniref:Uncharacterized protein n=1 Tax=Rhizobium setariae TaxID=2801340 RepID=A0A936YQ75_9HYPH|nr:DUF6656 family protein [Rhizobium setariae]MBL0370786.1 hypothetical protein [Rhizobium setariae]
MAKLQYFERDLAAAAVLEKPAVHTEFLRTGRIDRTRPNWEPTEKRYLSYEEVAERTGKVLSSAGVRTHERLNNFHRSIQFPRMIFHRTLKGTPHLGYCHVTAAKSSFAEYKDVKWSFYIANFSAEIATEDLEFHKINMRAERMYFAVAMEKDEEKKKFAINRSIRGNGLLFRTHDPKMAMKNVLLLGAKHEAARRIINAL